MEFGKLERWSKSEVVIHLIEMIGRVHQMWKFISLNNEKSKLDVLIHLIEIISEINQLR